MKKLLIVAAVALAIGGCAGNKSDGQVAANNQSAERDDMICRAERTTGSMLKMKKCKTQAQIDAEREEARNTMHTIHSSITGATGTDKR
ncbi:hypothetical protein GCM10009092_20020 [Bowmanella denitrificans]|uniref:Lipoprotein n=1 Tax=Bowmanella denitrificans TaxID=366582 RepID=A0ABP3GXB4_9ALTE|nr:hypothetical protein [Bowmanella denitrificans]